MSSAKGRIGARSTTTIGFSAAACMRWPRDSSPPKNSPATSELTRKPTIAAQTIIPTMKPTRPSALPRKKRPIHRLVFPRAMLTMRLAMVMAKRARRIPMTP